MTNRRIHYSKKLLLLRAFLLAVTLIGAIGVPLHAQTFEPIQPLFFVKPFGGADPLPQVMAVANIGNAFDFSVSSSTSGNSGNWLSTSPSGDCCIAPEAVAAIVTTSPTMAMGTYTGQIVFMAGNTSLTVAVTLVVTPPNGIYFDNLPGQLSFSTTPGGTLASQVIQIRSAGTGAGPLNWNLTTSTFDGGNWLTVTSTSGTAPKFITVGIQAQNLPGGGQIVGTYGGQLLLQTTGSAVTVPISVTIGASVFEQVNPLYFTKPYTGQDPLEQTVTIASSGAQFDYSVQFYSATGGNWLSVSPSGDCCVSPEALEVSANPLITLPAGTYTGEIWLISGHMSMVIPVTMTVAPLAGTFLDNVTGGLSYSLATSAATTPPSQLVQIRNGSTFGTVNWTVTATTGDNGNWLTVSQMSGSAPTLISIGILPQNFPGAGLTPGVFVGNLLFQEANSSVTVPISVVVGNAFKQINGLNFTMLQAGPDPLPQTLAISSTGTAFDFTVDYDTATGGNWLTVSPSGDCCVTPGALTVTVTAPVTMPAGTYTAEIITSNGHQNMTIPVTLTVVAPGSTYLDNLPGQLSFTMPTNGQPAPQGFQIRSIGPNTLSWNLSASTSDGGNWLTVSQASGTAPFLVTVGIVPANLPSGGLVAGVFSGQLLIQAAGSTATIPVSVTVGGNAFGQINGINFTMPQAGANPLPQTLTVTSIGNPFDFVVSYSTATGGNWLSVSPSGDCCVSPGPITVSVTAPVTLPAGIYTGQVVFNNGITTLTVPVTLSVVAPASGPFFDNVPGQLAYSLITGAGNPPSQMVQIRNRGAGTLPWTAAASTFDGGNWLTVSQASGTAPSLVTIGIVTQKLPSLGLVAGVFTGQVLFLTASSSVTIPVSVVVGGNGFAQVNGIAFTMPAGGANPLPQILSMTSIGAAFDFVVDSATGNGGNWFTVSPIGDCCVSPEVLTVTVNAPVGLAAGTYTGQITSNNGHTVATVPVTLTVAAPSAGPLFDNVQGQMSFSGLTGSTPASQTMQIRSIGNGPLNWTLTPMTADGGNWLTVSATSGLAPSNVTVGIAPQNLPSLGLVAGLFTGQLLFQTDGSSVTVPVSVNLGPNVFTQLGPLTFTTNSGTNPLSQTLTGSSTGSRFDYVVSSYAGNGGNWLSTNPTGDCCVTPEPITVQVTNPTTPVPPGTFTGQVVFSRGSAAMTVPVTLTVNGLVTYTLTPGSVNVPATGGTGSVSVTASSQFGQWTAVSNASWITITSGASGTGNGAVNYTVAANTLAPSQTGTLTIAGQTFTVIEAGTATFTLSATSVNVPVTGGTGSVGVTASSQTAAWTAVSNASWITITSGASGTGNGTVNYTVAANTLANSQTGTLTIAGVTFTVIEAGTASFTLNPTSANIQAAGGNGIVSVTVSPLTATWTAVSNVSWITIVSGASGTGNGNVTYNVTRNTGPNPQTGTLTIAGLTFTVTQAGTATFSLSASSVTATAAGGPGSVGVTASSQAATWTAVSNVAWITISSGASGTGNGTVNYTVTPTSLTTSQTGTLTIAGQTFTVTQAGATFTLNPTSASVSAAAGTGSVTVTSTSSNAAWTVFNDAPTFVTITSGNGGTGSGTVNYSVAANTGSQRFGTLTIAGQSFMITQSAGLGGMAFYPVTPCRVVDTRAGQGKSGQFGPPTMAGNSSRDFAIPASNCGIPATAQAYSLNVTVVPPGPLTYLSIWPSGQPQPVVSTLNSLNGAVVANAAIVPAGTNGAISVFVSNQTDVIIDVNGYFAPQTSTAALAFYPVTPCRVADTRAGQGQSGAFGPPTMAAGTSRDFPVPSSACGIPATAQAYSLNMTVAPAATLNYLTTWPAGLAQPVVSTLNSLDGRIVANAAIVPAGANGSISVFVSNTTDVIIDINGYFAPPGGAGALGFYPVTPCRMVDTRTGQGTPGALGPPQLLGNASRDFPLLSSSCGLPTTTSTVQAYSLNMTVVPPGPLIYLTTWPTGLAQPVVSTLNAVQGTVVANAALVPAGLVGGKGSANGNAGSISVFVSNATDLIIDVNGYFAK